MSDFTNQEIKESIFYIDVNKTLGLNGFNNHFYKEYWGIVSGEVCKTARHVIKMIKLERDVNGTHICLIPKTHFLLTVKYYTLITCCNILQSLIQNNCNKIEKYYSRDSNPQSNNFYFGEKHP